MHHIVLIYILFSGVVSASVHIERLSEAEANFDDATMVLHRAELPESISYELLPSKAGDIRLDNMPTSNTQRALCAYFGSVRKGPLRVARVNQYLGTLPPFNLEERTVAKVRVLKTGAGEYTPPVLFSSQSTGIKLLNRIIGRVRLLIKGLKVEGQNISDAGIYHFIKSRFRIPLFFIGDLYITPDSRITKIDSATVLRDLRAFSGLVYAGHEFEPKWSYHTEKAIMSYLFRYDTHSSLKEGEAGGEHYTLPSGEFTIDIVANNDSCIECMAFLIGLVQKHRRLSIRYSGRRIFDSTIYTPSSIGFVSDFPDLIFSYRETRSDSRAIEKIKTRRDGEDGIIFLIYQWRAA